MIYKLGVLNQGLQATLRNMASNMTFADWRAATNESLMTTAENLLDNLEDIADLLTEINDKYIKVSAVFYSRVHHDRCKTFSYV